MIDDLNKFEPGKMMEYDDFLKTGVRMKCEHLLVFKSSASSCLIHVWASAW